MGNYKLLGIRYIGHSKNDTVPSATNKNNYLREDTDTSKIWYSDGTNWNILSTKMGVLPSRTSRKWGTYQGTATWDGIWGVGGIGLTTAATITNATDGRCVSYTTASGSAGAQSGWKVTVAQTFRALHPRSYFYFRMNGTVTHLRTFIGHTSGLTGGTTNLDISGDDPLLNKSGIMLGSKDNDSVWTIAHNGGTGSTVFDTITAVTATIDTNWHSVEIYGDDANSQWLFSFDGNIPQAVTTSIPTTAGMGVVKGIETADTTAKVIYSNQAEIEQDK